MIMDLSKVSTNRQCDRVWQMPWRSTWDSILNGDVMNDECRVKIKYSLHSGIFFFFWLTLFFSIFFPPTIHLSGTDMGEAPCHKRKHSLEKSTDDLSEVESWRWLYDVSTHSHWMHRMILGTEILKKYWKSIPIIFKIFSPSFSSKNPKSIERISIKYVQGRKFFK